MSSPSPRSVAPCESESGYTSQPVSEQTTRDDVRHHPRQSHPPPPAVAQVSGEAEKLLMSNPSIKLRSTDLLIFKCLLSAVKFCIFCKPFSPNSRRLKSYIWFFYIPLFSTKCGFYLE